MKSRLKSDAVCPQCGGPMRDSRPEDSVFPGDHTRYPKACDACGVMLAADASHTFEPKR